MGKISFLIILVTIGLAMVWADGLLEVGKKYKIMSGDGALSVVEVKAGSNLTVHVWNATDHGQQWKFEKAFGTDMYLIRSVLDENLVVDVEASEFGFFTRLFSFGNQRHWKVTNVSDEHYELKNKRYGLCLKSFGLDEPVDVSDCGNSTHTQWTLTKLEEAHVH